MNKSIPSIETYYCQIAQVDARLGQACGQSGWLTDTSVWAPRPQTEMHLQVQVRQQQSPDSFQETQKVIWVEHSHEGTRIIWV